MKDILWDLVIVDEVYKMAVYKYGEKIFKIVCYILGEVIFGIIKYLFFFIVIFYRGDLENFRLLLDFL